MTEDNKNNLNQEFIDEIKIESNYSDTLKQFIKKMLKFKPSDRPSYQELLTDEIFNKKQIFSNQKF